MLHIILLLLLLLSSAATAAQPAANTIMVFGDSISSGYGLPQGAGWVNLLQRRLLNENYDYRVVNASVTGETTTGGRNRIKSALAQHKPGIVIVELGGNDGLRGASPASIRDNLQFIISACLAHGSRVLVAGMQLPPNYGRDYSQKFRAIFPALAGGRNVIVVPFIFEGFAADREAFQPDGIHPNAASQSIMLDNVWPRLRPMLRMRGAGNAPLAKPAQG